MQTKTINLYTFDECDADLQEKILDNNRYWNVEYLDWWDFTVDQFKEIGSILGIDIDQIYFSGFCSQGDGACFTGDYSYKKGALKKIKSEFPKWNELHGIAQQLQDIQKRYLYQLEAVVSHRGRYYHELCTNIDVSCLDRDEIAESTIDELTDILREFMQLIYSGLESEYEYLTSDESIKESLICNEYLFDENGDIQ